MGSEYLVSRYFSQNLFLIKLSSCSLVFVEVCFVKIDGYEAANFCLLFEKTFGPENWGIVSKCLEFVSGRQGKILIKQSSCSFVLDRSILSRLKAANLQTFFPLFLKKHWGIQYGER